MTARFFLPVLAATLMPIMAQGQGLPGDPVAGLAFARGHCAECHYVERDWIDLFVNDAPDFLEIAEQPAYTAMALNAFLQTPHEQMPDFILTPTERDDVISYILTLRKDLENRFK